LITSLQLLGGKRIVSGVGNRTERGGGHDGTGSQGNEVLLFHDFSPWWLGQGERNGFAQGISRSRGDFVTPRAKIFLPMPGVDECADGT
jgi:hypothetical protein